MFESARQKLELELKTGSFDKYADVMKKDTCEALLIFCKQDEEFAQAVVEGGSFEDCMKAVAKDCRNGISDLEAYRRAVQFYFVGKKVKFIMHIEDDSSEQETANVSTPKKSGIVLDLADFF